MTDEIENTEEEVKHLPTKGTWAIIENTVVMQTQPSLSESELASGLFTDIPKAVFGQIYDSDNETISDPEPDLDGKLSDAKAFKTTELTSACESAITGGFTSNAVNTGQHYTYDSREVDQTNLIMALAAADLADNLASEGAPAAVQGVLCNDPSGQLGMIERDHTALQIRGVLSACNTHRRTHSATLTSKLAALALTTTEAAALAISW